MNVSGLGSLSSPYYAAVAPRPARSGDAGNPGDSRGTTAQPGQLSPQDEELVRKLRARDKAVRQHEQAHLAAAGGIAISGASFTYQKGPDGIRYAVGGEVSIDTSGGNTPEETLRRAQTIRGAALAPAEPSGQDRAVAAQAAQMEQQAYQALARQRAEATAASDDDSALTDRRGEIERFYGSATTSGNESVDIRV